MPTTMAGAATTTKSDTHGVFFQLADGSISGGAEFGIQGGQAINRLSVFKFVVADVVCSDGKTRITLTTLRAFADSPVIKISKDLKSATASGTVSGQEDIYNDCTQTDTYSDLTFGVKMNFHSTSGITTTKTHTVTRYPDRSKDVFDDTFASRDAAGTVVLGGTSYSPDASIVHEV
ncbi:MAG: hypothetical protein ABI553_07965, partial [Chloroflexota bacterium]